MTKRFITTIAILIVYFSIYLLVQRIVSPSYDFSIPLDYMIPFIPETIWLYLSIILFFICVPIFLSNDEFQRLFNIIAIAYLITLPLFILLPSNYPRIDYSTIQSSFYQWAYATTFVFDKPNNTFPSLHISLTWITGLFLYKKSKWILLYAILITLSVLTTKQHFILDICGGLVVVCVSYRLEKYIRFPKIV